MERIDDFFKDAPANINVQLVYKLATMESKVAEGFQRLDDKFDRVIKDLNDHRLEISTDLVETKAEIKANRQDLDKLIKWRDNFTARSGGVLAVCFAAWALFGDALKQLVGSVF